MARDVKLKKSLLGKYSLAYACPNCDARLTSPVDDAGSQDSCPDCSRLYVVPGADHKANVIAIRESEKKKRHDTAQAKKNENELKRETAIQKRNAENLAAKKRAESERQRTQFVAQQVGQSRVMKETEAKSAKGEGVLIGCIAGWGVSGCLIPLGILLCLTGIGAIIGIPLILAGLLAPFLGPVMGLGSVKGECPWCGTQVTTNGVSLGVDCPACKKRIVVKGKRFIKVE